MFELHFLWGSVRVSGPLQAGKIPHLQFLRAPEEPPLWVLGVTLRSINNNKKIREKKAVLRKLCVQRRSERRVLAVAGF